MKRVFALFTTILIIAMGGLAAAQAVGVQTNAPRPVIKTLGVIGKGLAISQSDPMDFKLLKIAIGKVKVSLLGEETELMVGVLFLDKDRYKVKDIVLGNDTITANLYSNDTRVGSLEASSVTKGDTIVWAGTLNVNNENYNIYVLEVPRKPKPFEIADKVKDFCKENPKRCLATAKGVVRKAEDVKNFCENNPDDERCRKLFRLYCQNNLQDSRCREALKDYCEEHEEEEICQNFELRITKDYCTNHPRDMKCAKLERKRVVEYCVDHPDDNKCVALKKAADLVKRLDVITFCKNHPDSERCDVFCDNHPLACKRAGVPFELAETTETAEENQTEG